MQIKKYNISKPENYKGKDGQEKTMWHNIGTVTEFHKDDGSVSTIMDIPAIGLKANVFPFQEKQENQRSTTSEAKQPLKKPEGYPEEEINPDDIPF